MSISSIKINSPTYDMKNKTFYNFVFDCSSNNIVVTLPPAIKNNSFLLYRIDNSGNTLTFNRQGSDTINNGLTSVTMGGNEQCLIRCVEDTIFNFPVIQTRIISSPVSSVNSVFSRSGNVTAQEGDYSLNLLSDATITSPASGQVLRYNGSQWINQTKNSGILTFGTSGNYANNQFISYNGGSNGTYENTSRVVPLAFTASNFTVALRDPPGAGNSATFTLYKNGVATSITATIANTAITAFDNVNTLSFVQGDTYSVFISDTGGSRSPAKVAFIFSN